MTGPRTRGNRVPVRRFVGSVALVVNAATDLGRATCERLAAEGAWVWVADRDAAAAQALAAGLSRATARPLNPSDAVGFAALATEIRTEHDGLDVLVNGLESITAAGAPLWEASGADWGRSVTDPLSGVINGCRAVLPDMCARGQGAIVNVASDAGLVGWQGHAASSTAASAVIGLTRAAAMDAAPGGVRVNCVCPSLADVTDAASNSLLGRRGSAAEVAAAIAFLASAESSFVTGVALPVDGGATAR